jgi:hypothetical protein
MWNVDSGLAGLKTRFWSRRVAFLNEKSRIRFSAGGEKVDSGPALAKTRFLGQSLVPLDR